MDRFRFQMLAGNVALTASFIAFAAVVILSSTPPALSAQDPATPTDVQTIILEEAPRKPDNFDRVYDIAGRLSQVQFDRFHFDIGRMWDDGFPAMIYIRRSSASEPESLYFADQLRQKWEIESSPGADDGIVLLVTIRETFPHTAELSLSYGVNSFPSGQMTVDVLNDIVEEEANPRIRVGNVNGGLTYVLRRILYYTEYSAPFPEPLTENQRRAQTAALPVSLIALAAVAALTFAPLRRFPSFLRSRSRFTSIVIAVFSFGIAAAIAVYGQSNSATAVSLINLILVGILAWRLGRAKPTATNHRVLTVGNRRGRRRHRSLSRPSAGAGHV